MEKILVLNAGSTSLKFQLFNMSDTTHEVISKGGVERIGLAGSKIAIADINGNKFTLETPINNHKDAIQHVLDYLTHKHLKNASELSAIGHRMGYGGENFDDSVVIDDRVMQSLYDSLPLIPLHGPAFVSSINALKELLPGLMQVATFDTAFHQSISKDGYLYAIPREYYTKEQIRRYGFHGTSHKYANQMAAEILGYKGRFICCHLGGGSSVTAVKDGKSVATSMGYVPTSGIMMSTRPGDIDPYIPLHIMKTQHKTADEVNTMLNKECGLYGLTNGHADMRDIIEQASLGNELCSFAIDAYIYNLLKTVGSYVALLGGLDALIFTAGIGENSPLIRQKLCDKLAYLGLDIDADANNQIPAPQIISSPQSKVKVLVITANEELQIAKETYQVYKNSLKAEQKAV